MRRPILVLVLLLVALRGWMGSAVAMPAPAAPQHCGQHAAAHGSASAVHGQVRGSDDDRATPARTDGSHGSHAAHGDAPSTANGTPAAAGTHAPGHGDCGEATAALHAGHGDCGDCQVCHSAVSGGTVSVASPPAQTCALSVRRTADFASADPAPSLRPPISRSSRP